MVTPTVGRGLCHWAGAIGTPVPMCWHRPHFFLGDYMYTCSYACPHCQHQQRNWTGECDECGWIDSEPEILTEFDDERIGLDDEQEESWPYNT
jgi:hypothetical protein